MAAKTKRIAPSNKPVDIANDVDRKPVDIANDVDRKPVVVVDGVHIIYKVFASGRRATKAGAGGGLFSRKMRLREVHAVKGLSFTVFEGESVGIIGSNGSGKSSLMRAIAGLTPIQGGAVYASAKPALLGVGAVLLPNLSGEKNILLGGLAMGFGRKDMLENTDAITQFAGLEEFIDLPMRTYSSGMSARLRFAIAASRDHDILIIDEALAVGDQEFRNRSEARMREMRDSAGTVFLVSHSMKSILDTCTRVIWIEKGELIMDGEPLEVINAYNVHTGSDTID
jgi:teichoic acid transport system ATP-binding protein